MKTIYKMILTANFLSLTTLAGALDTDRPGYLPRYQYEVTDVATRGLTADALFGDVSSSAGWMDLKHSVCSNRSHVWAYDLYRKRNLQPGTIFVFFARSVWKNDRKGWHYHAGTYVMENGTPKVLEGSYPRETRRPQTVVEWMNTEMEGRVDARKCIQITEDDTDLTEYFYQTLGNLPEKRSNGKAGSQCYYRMVPGYIAYPYQVAEVELGLDEDGKKSSYAPTAFDLDQVYTACIDSYAGRDHLKKLAARKHCKNFLR